MNFGIDYPLTLTYTIHWRKNMALTKINTTQTKFLETYLKAKPGRKLSADQAKAMFGIMNLRARCSELRKAGMSVKTETNRAGKTTYSIV